MHGGSVGGSGKLFMWTNDSSTSYMVSFVVNGAACPNGGCTYSWDFGTGSPSTGTSPAELVQFPDGSAVTVTLTVNGTATSTQVVTPTAVHQLPTCGATAPTSGTVGTPVSLTDSSTADGSAAVYVNWGDGSPMSVGALGSTLPHTYIWSGNYMVTQIVQDSMGFSCTVKYPVPVSKAGVAAGSGTLDINTDATFPVSYYVKADNGFGTLVTKVSGSLATGDNNLTLVPDTYSVYLYFADGHSCTWTQGQSAVVTDGGSVTVSAAGCL